MVKDQEEKLKKAKIYEKDNFDSSEKFVNRLRQTEEEIIDYKDQLEVD